MAETADDLSTPLGQQTARRKRRFRLPFTGMQALAVLLGLFLAVFAGFAIFGDNPLGGEPVARIALRPAAPPGDRARKPPWRPPAPPSPAPNPPAKQAAPAEQKTVTIIDGSSGKRQDVVIGGDAADKTETDEGARHDGRGGSAPAGKIALRHDPGGRGRIEAVHGLRRRSRPRQGGQNARGVDRRRRPWGRRGQDHRCDHEAAVRGDAGVYALWLGSLQAGGTGARAAPRDPAADPDGAVRLSRQRPRAANPAHDAAPEPISIGCTGISAASGLCRDRQFHGRALRRVATR